MVDDKPAALLTNTQRELILGIDKPTHPRKTRKRMRNRIYEGLRFDGVLLPQLDPEDRQAIFSDWEKRDAEPHARKWRTRIQGLSFDDIIERKDLRLGIEGLLAFVYLGVDEGDVVTFEALLEDALDRAARQRGQHLMEFDLTVEFADPKTLEDIERMVETGELEFKDLTIPEIKALYQSGYYSEVELEERISATGLLSQITSGDQSEREESGRNEP